MKQLLNNPYIIAGLVVCSAAIVGKNIWGAFSENSLPADEELIEDWMDDELGETIDLPVQTHSRKLVAVSAEKIFWNEHHQRDPFAHWQNTSGETRLPNGLIEVSATINIEPPVLPTLMGLVAGGSTKMAVVNGIIVNEGGNIDGYRVRKITPDAVIVELDDQFFRLTLPEG